MKKNKKISLRIANQNILTLWGKHDLRGVCFIESRLWLRISKFDGIRGLLIDQVRKG